MLFTKTVNEQTTAPYTATLKDSEGLPVSGAALTSLELWLYDVKTNAIINTRGAMGGSGQNVLNANNVTVDSDGLLTWNIQGSDNAIVNPTLATEAHRAVFRATWGSPAKTATHQFTLNVVNLRPIGAQA